MHAAQPTQVASDEATVRQLEKVLMGISRIVTRVRMQKSMLPAGSDLSPTESWLLRHLVESGPLRMSALARWQGVDRSTMTAQINRLERMGLVRRADDPSDRRAILVHVTQEGEAAHHDTVETARRLCSAVLEGWQESEREELNRSLGRLVGELERVSADPGSL